MFASLFYTNNQPRREFSIPTNWDRGQCPPRYFRDAGLLTCGQVTLGTILSVQSFHVEPELRFLSLTGAELAERLRALKPSRHSQDFSWLRAGGWLSWGDSSKDNKGLVHALLLSGCSENITQGIRW